VTHQALNYRQSGAGAQKSIRNKNAAGESITSGVYVHHIANPHNPNKPEPNRLKKNYPNGWKNDQRIKTIESTYEKIKIRWRLFIRW